MAGGCLTVSVDVEAVQVLLEPSGPQHELKPSRRQIFSLCPTAGRHYQQQNGDYNRDHDGSGW
jgi:hypothetical protein